MSYRRARTHPAMAIIATVGTDLVGQVAQLDSYRRL